MTIILTFGACSSKEKVEDKLSDTTSLNLEDSFEKNYKKGI